MEDKSKKAPFCKDGSVCFYNSQQLSMKLEKEFYTANTGGFGGGGGLKASSAYRGVPINIKGPAAVYEPATEVRQANTGGCSGAGALPGRGWGVGVGVAGHAGRSSKGGVGAALSAERSCTEGEMQVTPCYCC